MDFVVPADLRIKLKEYEKKDKYLNLARELKKNNGTWRWNQKEEKERTNFYKESIWKLKGKKQPIGTVTSI